MKCTLVLAAVCAVLVLVTSERCSNVGDCSHVSCDSSTTLGCSHGECTCLEGASTAPCPQNWSTCFSRDIDCDKYCTFMSALTYVMGPITFASGTFYPFATCAARSDCDSCSCHGNRQHHCFDERCTCGFGFGK